MRMSIEDGPGDTLSPSESLDSDDVRNNDGDDVVDPPDGGVRPTSSAPRRARSGRVSPSTRSCPRKTRVMLEEQSEVSLADLPDDQLTEDVDRVIDDEEIDIPVFGNKHADVVEGVIVQDSRTDRGQIDGSAEDGDSFFTVLD